MSKNSQKTSFLSWYHKFLSQFGFVSSVQITDKDPEWEGNLTANKKQGNSQDKNVEEFDLSVDFSKGNGFAFSNRVPSPSGTGKGQRETTRMGSNALGQMNDTSKQQVVSITYEEIGLFPRSFNRVFDRFFKQLFFDVENLVIQEYRFYRYLFLTTVKCVFILISVPLFVNFCSKTYLIRPITEYYWNAQQPEIFLNSYMQKRAFNELKDFEETIYFESLILPSPGSDSKGSSTAHGEEKSGSISHSKNEKKVSSNLQPVKVQPAVFLSEKSNFQALGAISPILSQENSMSNNLLFISNQNSYQDSSLTRYVSNSEAGNVSVLISNQEAESSYMPKMNIQLFQNQLNTYIQKGLQHKTLELANHYNEESVESITNFFADLMSFGTLWFLISSLEIQINITKSFLLEVFFGLDDSKKSLLILFVTDLLVGYHSPNIWELFFSSFFDHYGLPENETTIFLLVATLPVLLDVLFKYLIFRHLNRASPATVATYHAMIE